MYNVLIRKERVTDLTEAILELASDKRYNAVEVQMALAGAGFIVVMNPPKHHTTAASPEELAEARRD